MKIEVFEILSKEDKIYLDLLEQYNNNSEVKMLMNEFIIDPGLVLMGDFRLINMIDMAIDIDDIKVYLVKDTDNDIFIWVIGKFEDGKISMYPLLKEQSKEMQLEIKSVLIKNCLFENQNEKD